MTLSLSLMIVLLIALWSTANGVDLGSNTIILSILLIALVALSRTSYNCRQSLNNNLNNNLINSFI